MIGQTISHYKILEKLGEGGMGVVYKAQDLELDRIVALKFLSPLLTSDEAERKRFEHEARAVSALDHPNICTFYELGKTDRGQLFIAMAYYEGQTVRDKVKDRPLPLPEALDIAIAVAQGLSKAHEKGVTHRDIKSENVIVTNESGVKIMDFGLARIAGASTMTKTGTTLGTVPYMSPEQARGEKVDHRSDIWSLGAVLYEMVTGLMPFKSEHHDAMVYLILNENPQPVTSLRTGIPMALERIISKCLEKKPSDRYQHMDEVIVDLRHASKEMGNESTSHDSAIAAAPTGGLQQTKRVWRYITAVFGVLAIGVVLLVFNPFNFQISMQQSTAAEKNSLAVVHFQNIPDPEDKDHTGDMLADLLITALSQTRDLDVISRERLFDIQRDLGQADTKTISASTATQVAKRAGVRTMLLGTIHQKEPTLVITARLIDVESGKIVGSQRLTSFTTGQIFNLVDSLALLIRSDFKIATTSAETKSVAEVTTNSPEAFRSYVEGVELARKIYSRDAVAALERAVELDKDFAMAYYWLFITQENAPAKASLQKAVDLSDRVTELEQLLILSANYIRHNNLSKAEETTERLIERYPKEIIGYQRLGDIYARRLEYEKVVQTYRRGLKVDPSNKGVWISLTYALAGLNRRDEALEAISEYLKLAPGEANPYDTKADVHAKFGEYDSARVWYQKAIGFRRDFSSATKLGMDALVRRSFKEAEEFFQMSGFKFPVIEIGRGLFKIAQKKLAEMPSTAFPQTVGFFGLRQHIQVAYEAGDYHEMLRLARELSIELNKDPEEKSYGRDYLAWALVKNGNASQAHRTLNEIQANLDPKLTQLQVSVDYASALVAFEEEKYTEAAELFRKVYPKLSPNHDPNLFFAVSLLKKGEIGEATSQLERLTRWYPTVAGDPTLPGNPGSVLFWPISSVKSHYWLGIAYEKQGDKQKAIKEYKTFLDIWKDADFRSPELADAKVRVSKLKGVAAK